MKSIRLVERFIYLKHEKGTAFGRSLSSREYPLPPCPSRLIQAPASPLVARLRYQESGLHLGLYSSLTSANNLNLNLLTLLLYSILTLLTSSSIVAVFTAKAGHVLG